MFAILGNAYFLLLTLGSSVRSTESSGTDFENYGFDAFILKASSEYSNRFPGEVISFKNENYRLIKVN